MEGGGDRLEAAHSLHESLKTRVLFAGTREDRLLGHLQERGVDRGLGPGGVQGQDRLDDARILVEFPGQVGADQDRVRIGARLLDLADLVKEAGPHHHFGVQAQEHGHLRGEPGDLHRMIEQVVPQHDPVLELAEQVLQAPRQAGDAELERGALPEGVEALFHLGARPRSPDSER